MKRKQQWCIRFSAILLLFCLFTQLIPMASAKRFTDVTRAAFPDYFDAINYVVDNGIMNGVSNTEFEPNSRVTRAMFITTLHRFAGTPADYISMPFNDVPSGHWAYNAIRWGVKNQIVSGTSATTFSPNEYVTREQAMTFLWRYLANYKHIAPYYYGSISDCGDYSSISNYARTPLYWGTSNSIIFPSGSSKLLYPRSNVYRKELALWINRYAVNVDGIQFGKDNFSYHNASESFDLDSNGRIRITQAHYNWLKSKLSENGMKIVDRELNSSFRGVCFGMSLSAILDKKGIIDFNKNLTLNCPTMFDMPAPSVSSSKHIVAPDRFNPDYTFAASENVITFFALARYATSIFSYKSSIGLLGNSITLEDMVNDLRTNGCILLEISFSYHGNDTGHVVAAYGMPVWKNGYYEIRYYDPNKSSEQIMKISDDYSTFFLTFGDSTVYPYDFTYCPEFFSIISSFDIDGDYNNSYSILTSTYANYDPAAEMQNPVVTQAANDEVWINLQKLGTSIITNAAGETLIYEKGKISGTMEVLDFRPGFDFLGYKVANSDFFSLQTNSSAIIFSVEWGNTFNAFMAEKAARITISQNSISAEGNVTNYSISAFTEANSSQRYELSGQAADVIKLDKSDCSATAESSSAYSLKLEDLYSHEVFSACESSDGTALTIQRERIETSATTSPTDTN